MDQEVFIKLYTKYLDHECTAEEKELLEKHLDELDLQTLPWIAGLGDKVEFEKRMLTKIHAGIKQPVSFRKTFFKWTAVAASVLLVASVIILYITNYGQQLKSPANPKQAVQISPGGNKALLTLSDGSTIVLDNAKNGALVMQGNSAIKKTSDGHVVYENGHSPDASAKTQVYNTISTPKGGEYQIVLADGTKVWLNAASSLTFPTAFEGKARVVELTGEAYFEIAKNVNMPFKVKANNAEVLALGTHFNVMAYKDEPELITTLLEGAVKFSNKGAGVLLKPGYQSVVTDNSTGIKVRRADIGQTMAWRNGYFVFRDENIQSIMRKISRWYDVDVEYKGNLADKEFGGKISRYKDIGDVLETLELTQSIHFKTVGRRIIVMP